jgi:predicted anti-sigma-YlaC factor YlaD
VIPNVEVRGHFGTRKPRSRNHLVMETQQCILCVVIIIIVVVVVVVAAVTVKYIKVECCTTMLLL